MILNEGELMKIIEDIKNNRLPLYPQEKFNRLEQYNILFDLFKDIPAKTCRPDLNKYLERISKLGSGNFGNVFEEKVIVKPYVGWRVILKQSKFESIEELINEIYMVVLCNIMVTGNVIPNLPLTYRYGFCVNNPEKEPKSYHYYIQEKLDRTLEGIQFPSPSIYNIITQGVMTIAALQRYMNVAHGDLMNIKGDIPMSSNIMLLKGPSVIYRYVLNNKTYIAPNHGETLCFIDFGTAQYLDGPTNYKTKEPLTFENLTNFLIHPLLTDTPLYNIDLVTFLNVMNHTSKDETVKSWLRGWIRELVVSPIRSNDQFVATVEKHLYPKIPSSKTESSKVTKVLTYNLDSSDLKIKDAMLKSLPGIVRSIKSEDIGRSILKQAYGSAPLNMEKLRETINTLIDDGDVVSFIQRVLPWWRPGTRTFFPPPDLRQIYQRIIA